MSINGVGVNASEDFLLKLKKGNIEKSASFQGTSDVGQVSEAKPVQENVLVGEQEQLINSNQDSSSIFSIENPMASGLIIQTAGAAASSSGKQETSDSSIRATVAQFSGTKEEFIAEMKKYLPDISEEEIGQFANEFFQKNEDENKN